MSDVLDDLKLWAGHKVGDPMPDIAPNRWGPALTAVLDQAVAEIERLRALVGAANQGDSFATIAKPLRHAADCGND